MPGSDELRGLTSGRFPPLDLKPCPSGLGRSETVTSRSRALPLLPAQTHIGYGSVVGSRLALCRQ